MNQTEQLTLVKPSLQWQAAYTEMVQEFMHTDEDWFNNFALALEDFPSFVSELVDEAAGIGLPPDVVPQQTFWLAKDDGTLLGEILFAPISYAALRAAQWPHWL